jgi:hypothetical protein
MVQNKICPLNVGGLFLLLIMPNNLKSEYLPLVWNLVLKSVSMFVLRQPGTTHGCLIITGVVHVYVLCVSDGVVGTQKNIRKPLPLVKRSLILIPRKARSLGQARSCGSVA